MMRIDANARHGEEAFRPRLICGSVPGWHPTEENSRIGITNC